MKIYYNTFILYFLSSFCYAQLTVKNDTYVFVDGAGFTSATVTPDVAPLFVTDDVRIEDTSNIFLRNDAQLLQGTGTTGNSGTGTLSVYQEGTVHNYAYNYWASPVGNINTDTNGNSPFKANASIFNDATGLITSNPAIMLPQGSNNGTSSPLAIASYWLWAFSPGTQYSEWDYIGDGADLAAGYGFSMKGTSGSANNQQYDFKGKPNSGTMNTAVLNGNYTLVGNPYPSALDAAAYIHDTNNASIITGTLFFWEHDLSVASHVLTQYVGGYATYTIMADGSMESFVPAPFATLGSDGFPVGGSSPSTSGKEVRRYIPIGQGFMIEGAADGNAQVKNSHRVYYKENDAASEFFKNTNTNSNFDGEVNNSSNGLVYDADGFQILPDLEGIKRFRLKVDFNNEITRQLLHNFHPSATNGFDYGLESNNLEPNTRDAYFILGDMPYITQAHNFDIDLKIPLVISIDADIPVKVRLFDVQNFNDQSIYLHDKITDVYHDITVLDFNINLATGTYTNRFEITFTNNDSTLSVDEFEASGFTVFQNNTISKLVVSNPKSLAIKSVALIDVTGKQVFKKTDLNNNTRYEFSTKNLSAGVYIASITLDNNNTTSKKVVISNK
ncbi:T9SS type A sorting domain-containing protein [Lacinutrix sp.]|uniref:T9SS type A sorting domain-containing protein n=1 Tax=Lacinutrix sp. TaxID=1937692 RepID=UPI0025BAD4F7|nr:T9SS type A sorting domain-containing protein [Lacinutrix sp.]